MVQAVQAVPAVRLVLGPSRRCRHGSASKPPSRLPGGEVPPRISVQAANQLLGNS